MSRSSTHFLFHYWDGHNLRDAFMEPWKGLTNVLGNERVTDGRVNLAFKTLGLNGFSCLSPVNHATILVTRKYLERIIFYLRRCFWSSKLYFTNKRQQMLIQNENLHHISSEFTILTYALHCATMQCNNRTQSCAIQSFHFCALSALYKQLGVLLRLTKVWK